MRTKLSNLFSAAVASLALAAPFFSPAHAQARTLCQAQADTECKNGGYTSYGYLSYGECYQKLLAQCNGDIGDPGAGTTVCYYDSRGNRVCVHY
jgi:hypothetical protein